MCRLLWRNISILWTLRLRTRMGGTRIRIRTRRHLITLCELLLLSLRRRSARRLITIIHMLL